MPSSRRGEGAAADRTRKEKVVMLRQGRIGPSVASEKLHTRGTIKMPLTDRWKEQRGDELSKRGKLQGSWRKGGQKTF